MYTQIYKIHSLKVKGGKNLKNSLMFASHLSELLSDGHV